MLFYKNFWCKNCFRVALWELVRVSSKIQSSNYLGSPCHFRLSAGRIFFLIRIISFFHWVVPEPEAHDLKVCDLQLFSLEQSWRLEDTNFMPNIIMGENKIEAACTGKMRELHYIRIRAFLNSKNPALNHS